MTPHAEIAVGPKTLPGDLALPPSPRGLVIFAHGSGSSRLSPRNRQVADALNAAGYATLLFDLLTEDEARDRRNVFDIALLGARVAEAIDWARGDDRVFALPIGLFGASTGAAAAIHAAAARKGEVSALVSRGGRPDLAQPWLPALSAPALFVVGGEDREVLALNQLAQQSCPGVADLRVIPSATHLFEEPGALESVTAEAADWFDRHLHQRAPHFDDRDSAGRILAGALARRALVHPLVYALPRGGVPVAAAIARTLQAPLDLILVRKIGAPGNPELALGAAVDGEQRDIVVNRTIARALVVGEAEITRRAEREFVEIERRRAAYLGGRPPLSARDRDAILVDDGIATGASMEAAIRALRRRAPRTLILAVPVAAPDSLDRLRDLVDAVVCLATPADFFGVGQFYREFHQLSDAEVIRIMAEFEARR
ncbi:alpha/beta family hydrolase [Rhodoblastus sp.]|uniref:alpha/beta family hydrolase n=1 Tax=Rhodoblastus sp. TaxID=1962975 RepID=UPI0035B015D2